MKNQKNWQRFQTALLLALCLAMVLPLFGCRKESAADEKKGLVVRSSGSAIAQLAELGEEAGYENALSELTEKNTTQVDGDSYYRLQQNYQGIPVYGRTVVCSTNEDGNVTSITGNVLDVDSALSLTPTVTQEQVEAAIHAYLTDMLDFEDTAELAIDQLSQENLYVYNMGSNEAPRLAYCIFACGYEFVIDAHNGEILACSCVLSYDTATCYNADGSKSFNGLKRTDGTYILKDVDRGIYICDAGNQVFWDPDNASITYPQVLTLVTSDDEYFGNEDDHITGPNTAFSLFWSLSQIYDYFAIKLQETGSGVLVGICNDAMLNYGGENAGGGFEKISDCFPGIIPDHDNSLYGGKVGLITVGTEMCKYLDKSKDALAHEYTHYLMGFHIGWTKNNCETGAISEGLADIFGELVEASIKDNDPDWMHSERVIRDPSSNGYPVTRSDQNNTNTDYAHAYSTVVSHAAYLMWNGGIDGDISKKISTDDLAKLWYRAMLMMPSDCDFAMCRKMVEWAALSINGLTDAQRTCISEAFDAVGIEDETLSPEILLNCDRNIRQKSALSVYGKDGNLHPRYTLSIFGTIAEQELAYADNILLDIGSHYEKTYVIDEAKEFELELPIGYYTFTISDTNNPKEIYQFTVSVSDKGPDDNIVLYTDFFNQLIVPTNGVFQTAETVTDALILIDYAIVLDALRDMGAQSISWELADPDDDGTLELYVNLVVNNTYGFPTHIIVDPDSDISYAYAMTSAATKTNYVAVKGESGFCLSNKFDSVCYLSSYYNWDGKSWVLLSEMSCWLSDFENKIIETPDDDAFWNNESVTSEEFLHLESTDVMPCEFSSPDIESIWIGDDLQTALNTLDNQLAKREDYVESIYSDLDGDGILEKVYFIQGAANKWHDTLTVDMQIGFDCDDESIMQSYSDSHVTVIVASSSGNGTLLRTMSLNEGKARNIQVQVDGFLMDSKKYDYHTDGAVFSRGMDPLPEFSLVSDAFKNSIPRSDGKAIFNYRIPKVELSGSDADETNATIYEDLYQNIYMKKVSGNEESPGIIGMTYSWAANQNVISIVAAWCGAIDPDSYYKVYNISQETGAIISNAELLSIYGLNKDTFYDLVKEKLESSFAQICGSRDNFSGSTEMLKSYDEQLRNTISDRNVQQVAPYIDASGDLCVVAGVYCLAGAGYYEHLINITGDTAPQEPEFSWVMPEKQTENTTPDELRDPGITGQYFIGTVTEPDAGAIAISSVQELVDKITADPDGNYVLACDIDLSTYNGGAWVPLEKFSGTMDGQGHVIRNLKVTSYEDAGLFLYVSDAAFKDLGIEAIEVSGYENTGVVSSKGNATFTNCYVTCPKLSGRDNIGGLIGRGDTSNLKDVFVDVSIQGNAEAYYSNIYEGYASICRTGGIIGKGSVDATNIEIHCDITITGSGKPTDGEIMAGGVIGCSDQAKSIKISNAEVNCTINVKTARFISWKTLSSGRRSYENVDVRVGGLVGDDYHDEGSYIQNAISISNCKVNANLDVDAYGTPCVGGFIGYEDGYNNSGMVVTIDDCSLTGTINALCNDGSYAKAGGILGYHPQNMNGKNTVEIMNTTVQCQVKSKGGYYFTYVGSVSGDGTASIVVKDCSIEVELNVTPGTGDVYIDGEKQ